MIPVLLFVVVGAAGAAPILLRPGESVELTCGGPPGALHVWTGRTPSGLDELGPRESRWRVGRTGVFSCESFRWVVDDRGFTVVDAHRVWFQVCVRFCWRPPPVSAPRRGRTEITPLRTGERVVFRCSSAPGPPGTTYIWGYPGRYDNRDFDDGNRSFLFNVTAGPFLSGYLFCIMNCEGVPGCPLMTREQRIRWWDVCVDERCSKKFIGELPVALGPPCSPRSI